jgi:hypothetical protein
MSEETFNPFDSTSYVAESQASQPEVQQTQPVAAEPEQVNAPEPTPTIEQTTVDTPKVETTTSDVQQPEVKAFEWKDDLSKTIYEKLVNKDVSDLADILYEQKVLSSLDSMDDADIIKLSMAYEYPDLTPEEIEEEFNSKFKFDTELDEDLYTQEELVAKRKDIEKQQKAINREMKKLVREAKNSLSEMKQDIDFPDILSQIQNTNQVSPDDVISQYLTKQQQEQQAAYQESRKVFESSIQDGLKNFDGFSVNYKDEDVSFDGKYSLTNEDKAELQGVLQSFDLDSFYGNRYFKDGKYDTKQLAEDVYFLQNRDKIVNAMVTQAVSKAKSDILKSMKNIDYSNQPRPSSSANRSDFDEMVSYMYKI